MAEAAGPGEREVKLQGQCDRREARTGDKGGEGSPTTPSPVHDHTSIYMYTCDGHTHMYMQFFADFTPHDAHTWYSCTYVRVTS